MPYENPKSDQRRYSVWAGNPRGFPEDKTLCVEEVYKEFVLNASQCSRKRGHGPNGEYCKQHAKKLISQQLLS